MNPRRVALSWCRASVAAGLVDELHLMVYPVVLGAGKRLSADSPELPFTLVESRPSSQVTLLTLRRA